MFKQKQTNSLNPKIQKTQTRKKTMSQKTKQKMAIQNCNPIAAERGKNKNQKGLISPNSTVQVHGDENFSIGLQCNVPFNPCLRERKKKTRTSD